MTHWSPDDHTQLIVEPTAGWKGCRAHDLAAVAQAGGDAVDAEVDALDDARVGVAGAVAAQQFDLHVVERIDVGEAVADRARQQRIALQQRLLPVMASTASIERLPFRAQAGEDRSAQRRRRRPARRSARRWRCRSWPAPCPCSTAWCGRTASRRASPAASPGRRPAAPPSHALTAAPKPYQPGSIRRHCAQLNTQGMARRSSMRCRLRARRRAAADVEIGDLVEHRRFAEVAVEASVS